MQILHPFMGSVQEYFKEISRPVIGRITAHSAKLIVL